MRKKKSVLAKFNDDARREALRLGARGKLDDGLTSAKRREKKIKKAANGCWWVEQFIRGNS